MSLLTALQLDNTLHALHARSAERIDHVDGLTEKSNSETAKIRYNLQVYRAENHRVRSVCNTESNGLGPKKLR